MGAVTGVAKARLSLLFVYSNNLRAISERLNTDEILFLTFIFCQQNQTNWPTDVDIYRRIADRFSE